MWSFVNAQRYVRMPRFVSWVTGFALARSPTGPTQTLRSPSTLDRYASRFPSGLRVGIARSGLENRTFLERSVESARGGSFLAGAGPASVLARVARTLFFATLGAGSAPPHAETSARARAGKKRRIASVYCVSPRFGSGIRFDMTATWGQKT